MGYGLQGLHPAEHYTGTHENRVSATFLEPKKKLKN
jgi:hypothetical protein